jgi:hypothetical protein
MNIPSGTIFFVQDWSIYGEKREIGGITITFASLTCLCGWFRVVKNNIHIPRFLDDIKPCFDITPCGYIIAQKGSKQHLLFPVDFDVDKPFSSLVPGFYTAETATQVRRILLFRDLFAVTFTTENSLWLRGEQIISVNEKNSRALISSSSSLEVLGEKLSIKWISPFTMKELLVNVLCKNVTVASFVLMMQTRVSKFSHNEDTAAVLHYAIRRFTEIAL